MTEQLSADSETFLLSDIQAAFEAYGPEVVNEVSANMLNYAAQRSARRILATCAELRDANLSWGGKEGEGVSDIVLLAYKALWYIEHRMYTGRQMTPLDMAGLDAAAVALVRHEDELGSDFNRQLERLGFESGEDLQDMLLNDIRGYYGEAFQELTRVLEPNTKEEVPNGT